MRIKWLMNRDLEESHHIYFRSVVYKEKIPGIKQLELLHGGARCMVGSAFTSMSARVSIKMFPEGDTLVTVEYPFKKFVPAVLIQVNL